MYFLLISQVDMALLYLSIVGFVIVFIGAIVYVGKFLLEKTRLTYLNVVFFVTYVTVGVVMIVKRNEYGRVMGGFVQNTGGECANKEF